MEIFDSVCLTVCIIHIRIQIFQNIYNGGDDSESYKKNIIMHVICGIQYNHIYIYIGSDTLNENVLSEARSTVI